MLGSLSAALTGCWYRRHAPSPSLRYRFRPTSRSPAHPPRRPRSLALNDRRSCASRRSPRPPRPPHPTSTRPTTGVVRLGDHPLPPSLAAIVETRSDLLRLLDPSRDPVAPFEREAQVVVLDRLGVAAKPGEAIAEERRMPRSPRDEPLDEFVDFKVRQRPWRARGASLLGSRGRPRLRALSRLLDLLRRLCRGGLRAPRGLRRAGPSSSRPGRSRHRCRRKSARPREVSRHSNQVGRLPEGR